MSLIFITKGGLLTRPKPTCFGRGLDSRCRPRAMQATCDVIEGKLVYIAEQVAPMKKIGFVLSWILALGFVSVVGPSSLAAGKHVYLLCRNKDVIRTLRVCLDRKTGDYRLIYTKNGKDEVKASGKSFDFVVTKLESIQENLEKSAWKCKDVSPSSHFHQRTVAAEGSASGEPEDCE